MAKPPSPSTVGMIGLGYIGLPTAALMAARGLTVIGIDINQGVVDALNAGEAHFAEAGLSDLVRQGVTTGALRAVTAPEPCDAFLIAVPTPVSAGREPDMRYVQSATAALAPVLKKGDLVILESTSPVGATEAMATQLAAARPDLSFPQNAGEEADILLAHCPERILPGQMLRELEENDRIIGGLSDASTQAALALYGTFVKGRLIPTHARTAELVKIIENAFRDVNIAFANEISKICDRFDINVWEAIRLANHHPRVNILQPGPGVGGHCIAVDPWFLVHAAPDLARLMQAAREVNDSKPAYVVEKVRALAQPGETIACLGLAYKPDNDDLRESPAVEVVKLLAEQGFGPLWAVEPNLKAVPPVLAQHGVKSASLEEALDRCDMVLLLVDHKEFKAIPADRIKGKKLYDSRGVWDPKNRP